MNRTTVETIVKAPALVATLLLEGVGTRAAPAPAGQWAGLPSRQQVRA